jgi:hypothetical protein
MQFNINKWRSIYFKVQYLGQMLKDALPDRQGYPAIAPLNKAERILLKEEIKTLIEEIIRYMDQCGLIMPKPLFEVTRINPSCPKTN